MRARNRLNRDALENLLEGDSLRDDPLSEVLSAARARGMPHEVAGLDAALAAFASATHSPATANEAERKTPVLKKLVTAKVLGAAVGALALGGVALAASTGSLPSPLPHSDNAASTAAIHVPQTLPAATPSAAAHTDETDRPGGADASDHTGRVEPNSAQPTTMPAVALPGLCRAWEARPHESGRADDSRPFTILVEQAGGADQVQGYCANLLATVTPGRSADHPTDQHTAADERRPGDLPTSGHPGFRPSDLPTPDRSEPTGRPTSLPSAVPSMPPGR